MSALNPNASVFVPAARRVVAVEERKVDPVVPVAVDLYGVVEDFSPEWWHLVQTDALFRERWLSMLSFSSEEERDTFAKDLDELADLDQFLDYQEELVDLEEEEIMALEMGSYVDDGQRVTSANSCKDVKSPKQQQQQQAAWSKSSFKYQNKATPQKVGNYPKKWNTYRIHQPRADM